MVIILDYPSGFSVIMEVLKSRSWGSQKKVRERDAMMGAERLCDPGGGKLSAEALKSGKGNEMDSPKASRKERSTPSPWF